MPWCKKQVKNAIFLLYQLRTDGHADAAVDWYYSVISIWRPLFIALFKDIFSVHIGEIKMKGLGGGGVASFTDGVVQNCMKLYIYAHVLKWSYKVINTFLFCHSSVFAQFRNGIALLFLSSTHCVINVFSFLLWTKHFLRWDVLILNLHVLEASVKWQTDMDITRCLHQASKCKMTNWHGHNTLFTSGHIWTFAFLIV